MSNAWTADQARSAWLKSAEVRRQRKADREARARSAPASPPAQAQDDAYLASRLARTRAQVDTLSNRLEEEITRPKLDAQQVDRLAAALERLADLERVLAGRPLPGSNRPSSRPAPAVAPILRPRPADPDPAPAPPGTP